MKPKKRQEFPRDSGETGSRSASGVPGTLYVVATPIGNLEDLSPRARRILGEVDGILCEDTRMTAKLLSAAGIERPDGSSFEGRLHRLDQHSGEGRIGVAIDRLAGGDSLALVSDAGTPAISDPGAAIVSRASESGIPVVPIPGASALTAFLSGSGFEEGTPVFRGFFPRKRGERAEEIALLSSLPFPSIAIWFESPERIRESVSELAERSPESAAAIAKELTKVHERFYRGRLKDITSHIQRADLPGELRGEWVLGVLFPGSTPSAERDSDSESKALRCLLNSGISASRAARELSQVFGISRNEAYARAVEMTKTGRTDDE